MFNTIKEAKDAGYTKVAFGKWEHCGVFEVKYFDKACKIPQTDCYDASKPNYVILEERISRVYKDNPVITDCKNVAEYRVRFKVYDRCKGGYYRAKAVDRSLVHWDDIRRDHPELDW